MQLGTYKRNIYTCMFVYIQMCVCVNGEVLCLSKWSQIAVGDAGAGCVWGQ